MVHPVTTTATTTTALERLGLLASAISGRALQVAPGEPGEPAWTDGRVVFVDADTSTREQLEAVAVQASLLAAGSLEPDVVRRLTRRPALARRYLAVEGHRALAAIEDLLPPSVRSLDRLRRRSSRRFAGRVPGCRAEPGGDRRPAGQLRSHPRATSAGVDRARRRLGDDA